MNRRTTRGIWRVHTVFVVCLVIFVGGCATTTFVPPENVDVGALRERAESAIQNDIRVSAAIPSRKNSIAIFGIDLSEKKIQPVWLEIENYSDRPVYFLRTGLDPEYFSPREVAFAFFESMSDDDKQRLIQHIESLNFRDPVAPHSSVSGFIFTNEGRETKFVTVDLLSPDSSSHLTLLVSIPERSLTEGHVAKIYAMIAETEPIRVEDESRLRSLLEKLPCCAASEDGVQGEPLNVVLIGDLDATGPALARRHFRYTPVSPLYVFGRPQDISLRKMGRWVAEQPHVLRAWLTKIRFRGKLVWIGQINMPKGGRFADASSDGSITAIDPDVDEARYDLLQDAIYSQLVTEIGFVKGAGPDGGTSPRTPPGGPAFYTDGLRAVMIFDSQPVSLTEIEFMSWERLIDHNRQ